MARMTSEERHKKQLEKLKGNDEQPAYEQKKSEKDLVVEAIEKKGYKVEYASGVPMFKIKKQSDANYITAQMTGKGSFGFKYPKDADIQLRKDTDE